MTRPSQRVKAGVTSRYAGTRHAYPRPSPSARFPQGGSPAAPSESVHQDSASVHVAPNSARKARAQAGPLAPAAALWPRIGSNKVARPHRALPMYHPYSSSSANTLRVSAWRRTRLGNARARAAGPSPPPPVCRSGDASRRRLGRRRQRRRVGILGVGGQVCRDAEAFAVHPEHVLPAGGAQAQS